MRNSLYFSMLLALAAATSSVSLTNADENVGRIPTVTRLVNVFFKLEGDLITAVNTKNVKVASKLLRDDFEMRSSAMPGSPIPRAAWLKQSLEEPKSLSTIDQMSVHDMGDSAIVSFSWKNKIVASKATQDIFVVDIWTRDSNSWKLAIRYAGPTAQDGSHVPGAIFSAPGFEKME